MAKIVKACCLFLAFCGAVPFRALGYNSMSYDQDGLLAQWDGIDNAGRGEHDASLSYPVDLTGNITDVTLVGNALVADEMDFKLGTGYFKFKAPDIIAALNAGEATIEFVFAADAGCNGGLFSFGSSKRAFWLYQWGGLWPNNCSYHGPQTPSIGYPASDGTNTVAFVLGDSTATSKWYWNGVEKGTVQRGTDDANVNDDCGIGTIGGSYSSNYGKGRVFSIRIYSKKLEPGALVQHRTIDVDRFVNHNSDVENLVVVSGDPENYGVVVPEYGRHKVTIGESIDCSAPTFVTNAEQTVESKCVGYKTYKNGEETANVRFAEDDERTFKYVHPAGSTQEANIVWQWENTFRVVVDAADGGSVTAVDDWKTAGTEFTVTATADSGFVFAGWQGDIPEQDRLSATVTLTVGNEPIRLTALFEESAEAPAVYLKADAAGARTGRSWANAYTDVAEAIAAANGEKPIYAAAGVYLIREKVAPGVAATIYGGFPGVSTRETLADRNTERYQTIFSGDLDGDDTWTLLTPDLEGYTAAETATGLSVISGGKVILPAFTERWQGYTAAIRGTNRSKGFTLTKATAVDGVWFVGFVGEGSVGSAIESSAKLDLNDCRFVGCNSTGWGTVRQTGNLGGSLTNTKFFGCRGGQHPGFRYESGGSFLIDRCQFVSSYRNNSAEGGSAEFFSGGSVTVRNCTITHSVDLSRKDGSGFYGVGLDVVGGTVLSGCVLSNNFVATTGTHGTPLLAVFKTFTDGLIADNRYNVKPVAGRGYALVGIAYPADTSHKLIANTVFRKNEVVAPDVALSSGLYYLGIVGQTSSDGTSYSIVNCVFDSNRAVAGKDVAGVTPRLCRGVYSLTQTDGTGSELGIANCTFRGVGSDGVCDVVQWGSGYTRPINIVNSLFTAADADVASQWLHADTPSAVRTYSCTVKNLGTAPAGLGLAEGLAFDDVPMDAAYVPQAKTPRLRETADVATNVAGQVSTFAFKPCGSDTWQALTPVASATVSSSTDLIGDLNGVGRPAESFTRGAVQPLSPAAENGHTLTLRRSPLQSGTLSGASAQAALPGDAFAAVTATASSPDITFAGWYTEAGELYSLNPTLEIASLDADLVLTAKFKAATVALTFDLGEAGTFRENGLSQITVEAEYMSAFPSVPAYDVSPEWVVIGWPDLPQTVPATDGTYRPKAVSSSVRIVYVTPTGAGNRDGTSWANAYGDLPLAYEDAGLYRGEVWMKAGVYVLGSALEVKSNVIVRGGFAGNESDPSEADPIARETIITGDVNGDDYWLIVDKEIPEGERLPIVSDEGRINAPNPDGTEDVWMPGGNSSDNTDCGISVADVNVTNAVFCGVVLASFAEHSVSMTSVGGSLRFERCRLVAGNTKRRGFVSQDNTEGEATLKVTDGQVDLVDCLFEGNFYASHIASAARAVTNTFMRCRFALNYAHRSSAMMWTAGSAAVVLDACTFASNVSDIAYGNSAPTLLTRSSQPLVARDCLFVGNRCLTREQYSPFAIMNCDNGGASTFERCRFIGNVGRQRNVYDDVATVFYGAGKVLVRDCYFKDNVGINSNNRLGTVLDARGGSWTFLNCTFEDNESSPAAAASGGLFYVKSGAKVALVNCTVCGTQLTGEGTNSELCVTSGAKVSIVNSAFVNEAAGYVPFSADGIVPDIANSAIAGFDAEAVPVAGNGYRYDVFARNAQLARKTVEGANGAWGRGVSDPALAKRGRAVWLKDSTVYFKDELANPDKPWRSTLDRDSFAASIPGLDLTADLVPDAFASPRKAARYNIGPVDTKLGLVIFFQ